MRLEGRIDEINKRNTRIIAVSIENQETAQLSQKQFPALSHVVIEIQAALERDGVHRKILEALPDRMPSLATRGILSMRCGTLSWVCKRPNQLQ